MCYDARMREHLKEKEISPGRETALLLALLALGFALRLWGLGSLPLGLNQDEASAGYDAWAIAGYGMDRCGVTLPVLLTAWGSGQNALLSYLSIPFIALLGLSETSIRIVPALFSCAALVVFYLFARRLRGRRFGLVALFFLALCPWHIMAGRWALESNLLPTLLLVGVCLVSLAREKPWALVGAAAAFALSPYAYGTAFFFLPFFLLFSLYWLRGRLRLAPFLVSLGIFTLLIFPIALCQLRNALGLPALTLWGLTLPELTETRQSATSLLGGGGLSAVWENCKTLVRILVTQSDGLPYNSGPWGGGIFYVFGLPLALLGLAVHFFGGDRPAGETPMLAALLLSLGCALCIDGNINRLNMLWLPLVYFAALGLHTLSQLPGRWSAVPAGCVLLAFALFFAGYVRDFGGEGYTGNFPGLGDAITYVEAREPESAYCTTYVNQPYIFVLYYTETPPENFLSTVDYINPDGDFRWVRSFGHWRFGSADEAEGDYLILHGSEAGNRPILATFGEYVVCAGET
jgi:4-amino-4-deoxy-L-arabinose transferase-like glycosyltransferase